MYMEKLYDSIEKKLKDYHYYVYGDLNKFGEEDISYIDLERMIKYPIMGILLLFKTIHYNEKYPNNMNIFICKDNDNMVNVFNGEGWKKKDFDAIVYPLISRLFNIIKEYRENDKKVEALARRVCNRESGLMEFLKTEMKRLMRAEKERLQRIDNTF